MVTQNVTFPAIENENNSEKQDPESPKQNKPLSSKEIAMIGLALTKKAAMESKSGVYAKIAKAQNALDLDGREENNLPPQFANTPKNLTAVYAGELLEFEDFFANKLWLPHLRKENKSHSFSECAKLSVSEFLILCANLPKWQEYWKKLHISGEDQYIPKINNWISQKKYKTLPVEFANSKNTVAISPNQKPVRTAEQIERDRLAMEKYNREQDEQWKALILAKNKGVAAKNPTPKSLDAEGSPAYHSDKQTAESEKRKRGISVLANGFKESPERG